MDELDRTLNAFAALRNVDTLRHFLDRHPELLTEEAAERLKRLAFQELRGDRPTDAVSTYLRGILLRACVADGLAAGFGQLFGSLNPAVPPELDAARVVLGQVPGTDGYEEYDILWIAVLTAEDALAHPAWPATPVAFRLEVLRSAAHTFHRAYLITSQLPHLFRAIQLGEAGIALAPPGGEQAAELLNNVAVNWNYAYDAAHDVTHLHRTIDLLEQVRESPGATAVLRSSAGVNLAAALRQRWELDQDPADLERAVAILRRLVAEHRAGPTAVIVRHNLANLLFRPTEEGAGPVDLDEAITLFTESLAIDSGDDHANTRLRLAYALVTRAGEGDLRRAAGVLAEGITIGSPDGGIVDEMTLTLARVQVTLARRGDPSLLTEAIELMNVYLLEREGGTRRPAAHATLGDALIFRYLAGRDVADLEAALEHHRSAHDARLRRRPRQDSGEAVIAP